MGKYDMLAKEIAEDLENADFSITDNSGYYSLAEYTDPDDGVTVSLTVCVNKEEDEGREYYAVFSVVDIDGGDDLTESEWEYTDTLSVSELADVLAQLASYYPPETLKSLYTDSMEDIVSTTNIKCDTQPAEFKIIECTTQEELEALGSALTFEGFDLDGDDIIFLTQWLEDHGCELVRPEIYLTLGATMNRIYNLTGNNKYPDDLNIVSIALDNIKGNIGNIVTARFAIGGRWLDDIIANNLSREQDKWGTNDDDYFEA